MTSSHTILIVGQASQKTGLARVTRAIATHLAAHDDVHVLGIDCADLSATDDRWTLHPNPERLDCYAESRLTSLMDEIRPSIVLLYNDLWVIGRYFEPISRAHHRCPIVGYCPIDGRIVRPENFAVVAPLDALVVFTEFARRTVRQCTDVSVIPHGLDTNAFHPLPAPDDAARRLRARQELFPDRPDLWDGFWVLNANRNQPRKRLDLTLQGFARFAAGKPANVRLYLHTGLDELGINIRREAEVLGITDRLVLTHDRDEHPASSTRSLNAIYNACDVGLNTATGEGWGLITCEHAATRAAQIVPRHSACEEIWDGAAELLPCTFTTENTFYESGVVDPADVAESLERIYSNHSHRNALAQSAFERITNPRFQWETIAAQWRAVFERKERDHELRIHKGRFHAYEGDQAGRLRPQRGGSHRRFGVAEGGLQVRHAHRVSRP
jgi:D-inositol-3-phosphate glycosyltransferase